MRTKARTHRSVGQRNDGLRTRKHLVAIGAGLVVSGGSAWAQTQTAAATEGGQQTLPEVKVTATSVATPASTVGSKTPLGEREIPQTISVTTREQIETLNLLTLEDAMRKTGGVTIERIDSNRLNFYSRGFEITSLLLDGLPTSMDDRVFSSPDLATIERVEVLKGPSGLLNGMAGPGGSINLVRKRPQREFGVAGSVGAGSWEHYRGEVDVSGALNGSGSVRGRAVVARSTEGLFQDKADRDKSLLYGVLDIDLTSQTLLSVGASHQDVDARVPWTLPAYSNFTLLDVPRSTYLGADWNREHYRTTSLFADLEHKLAGGWTAKLALRHIDGKLDYKQGYAWGAVDPSTDMTTLWALKFAYEQQQTGLDLYAAGPFSLFGRQHQLLVGVNADRTDFHDLDYSPQQTVDPTQGNDWLADLNVFSPISNVPEPAFNLVGDKSTVTDQRGVYGSARFSVTDPLTVVVGGRVNWWDATTRTVLPDATPDSKDTIDAEFTPYAGLIYNLGASTNAYASYASVFQPHRANFRDASGTLIDPLEGYQAELGVKQELLGGALMASAALFQIEQDNRAIEDPAAPPSSRVYVAQGKARSHGIELGLAGRIQSGWDLQADYAYTRTRNEDTSQNTGSAFSAIAPRHILRVQTDYRLPGEWNRWRVGGGVEARSSFYNDLGSGRLTQPRYTLVDARVAYYFSQDLSAQVAITNLLDETYYQRINNLNSGNLFGEPRAVMVTLRKTL